MNKSIIYKGVYPLLLTVSAIYWLLLVFIVFTLLLFSNGLFLCMKTVLEVISTPLVHFQNEREQIMTTNVWLTQVSVMKLSVLYSQSAYVLLNAFFSYLELNHIHSASLNVEQTASVIVPQSYSSDNEACN